MNLQAVSGIWFFLIPITFNTVIIVLTFHLNPKICETLKLIHVMFDRKFVIFNFIIILDIWKPSPSFLVMTSVCLRVKAIST